MNTLKPRTKAFVAKVLENPLNQTQAYLDTHKTTNRKAAAVEASKTLRKPSVMIYMQSQVEMAKRTLIEIAKDKEAKNSDRIKASQDILDRTLGKPTNKIESTNTNYNVDVLANEEVASQFMMFLKQKTEQV